jgi:hypothetical protein
MRDIFTPTPEVLELASAIEDASYRFARNTGKCAKRIYISAEFLETIWETPMDIDSLEIDGKKVFVDNKIAGKIVYCRR